MRPKRAERIAIDGPAASGKSAVGSRVAQGLRYRFLDTGAMYRALTWLAVSRGIDPEDEERLAALARETKMTVGPPPPDGSEYCSITVDGVDATPYLRVPAVEAAVSLVSRVPAVREALVERQRELARSGPIVMAGRDIGTTVLPDADLKVFLDAPRAERAGRRLRQFQEQGRAADLDQVLADLERRDWLDSQRAVSPLRKAEDAVVVETDALPLEDVVERVLALVEQR
ncbi:MAG TPA: (d)CMP kinase [Dehalococcoidia bacterium]